MIPAKLKAGDEVRVVSPSSGLGFIPPDLREIAAGRLEGLGLRCSFGGAGEVLDRFDPSERAVSRFLNDEDDEVLRIVKITQLDPVDGPIRR